MKASELLEQARTLSRAEQMELAHRLWIDADGPYDDPDEVEAAWATEIGRRVSDIANGSPSGVPHSTVRERFGS